MDEQVCFYQMDYAPDVITSFTEKNRRGTMDNITEDESKDIAKVIYEACKKRGIVFMPPAIIDIVKPGCIRKYRIKKKWMIDFISDSLVEKI